VKDCLDRLVCLLAPLAPHLAEELWESLGHSGGLAAVRWPGFDPELAREDEYEIVVQINGRVRGRVLAEAGLAEEEVLRRAVEDPKVAPFLEGKKIVKTVVIPNRLVNLVVR
jgi:leucyl-tRNA synthetase